MNFRFLCLLLFSAVVIRADAPKSAPKEEEVAALEPLVISGKPLGVLPFTGQVKLHPFSRKAKSPIIISGTIWAQPLAKYDIGNSPKKTLADFGVGKGEQLIAIDGRPVVGMHYDDLVRLAFDTGEAGDLVKLTLRGVGENATVYREIVVKRVALKAKSTFTEKDSRPPEARSVGH